MNKNRLQMLKKLLEEYRDDAADREEHDKRASLLFDVCFELEAAEEGDA